MPKRKCVCERPAQRDRIESIVKEKGALPITRPEKRTNANSRNSTRQKAVGYYLAGAIFTCTWQKRKRKTYLQFELSSISMCVTSKGRRRRPGVSNSQACGKAGKLGLRLGRRGGDSGMSPGENVVQKQTSETLPRKLGGPRGREPYQGLNHASGSETTPRLRPTCSRTPASIRRREVKAQSLRAERWHDIKCLLHAV